MSEEGKKQQEGSVKEKEMEEEEDVFELRVVTSHSHGSDKVPKDDTSFHFESENGKGSSWYRFTKKND